MKAYAIRNKAGMWWQRYARGGGWGVCPMLLEDLPYAKRVKAGIKGKAWWVFIRDSEIAGHWEREKVPDMEIVEIEWGPTRSGSASGGSSPEPGSQTPSEASDG